MADVDPLEDDLPSAPTDTPPSGGRKLLVRHKSYAGTSAAFDAADAAEAAAAATPGAPAAAPHVLIRHRSYLADRADMPPAPPGSGGSGGGGSAQSSGDDLSWADVATPPAAALEPARGSNPALAGWEVGGDYRLLSLVGSGSYGQVARAVHVPTDTQVAIKCIKGVFLDATDAKRILREIRILRELTHPRVVRLLDVLPPRDLASFADLYVVFELVETDLAKLLRSPRFLETEQVQRMVVDVLLGLQYLHSRRIVHRDLKPANVLMRADGRLVVCDFGLTRRLDPDGGAASPAKAAGAGAEGVAPPKRLQRQLTAHVASRWYRAPELILMDSAYTDAIDVWALGCIFAELLSMQKESCPTVHGRVPLFPGVSCFPLSPRNNNNSYLDKTDQLNVIFSVIGTPSEADIESIHNDHAKVYLRSLAAQPRVNLAERFPGAPADALDLLGRMLCFSATQRISIADALRHPYLAGVTGGQVDELPDNPVDFDFDESAADREQVRRLIVEQVMRFHPELSSGGEAAGGEADGGGEAADGGPASKRRRER